MKETREWTDDKEEEAARDSKDSISQSHTDAQRSEDDRNSNGVLEAKQNLDDPERQPASALKPKVPPPPNGGYG